MGRRQQVPTKAGRAALSQDPEGAKDKAWTPGSPRCPAGDHRLPALCPAALRPLPSQHRICTSSRAQNVDPAALQKGKGHGRQAGASPSLRGLTTDDIWRSLAGLWCQNLTQGRVRGSALRHCGAPAGFQMSASRSPARTTGSFRWPVLLGECSLHRLMAAEI